MPATGQKKFPHRSSRREKAHSSFHIPTSALELSLLTSAATSFMGWQFVLRLAFTAAPLSYGAVLARKNWEGGFVVTGIDRIMLPPEEGLVETGCQLARLVELSRMREP